MLFQICDSVKMGGMEYAGLSSPWTGATVGGSQAYRRRSWERLRAIELARCGRDRPVH